MSAGLGVQDLLGLLIGAGEGGAPVDPGDPEGPIVVPGAARVGELAEVDDREHLIVFEPDHPGRAVDLLYFQHKYLRRLPALAQALGAGAQLQELLSWSVILGASTLAGAEGVHLERWGALVGEPRGALSEDDFRRFIDLRVRVNSTPPNTDNLVGVLVDAVDPSVVSTELIADGAIYTVMSEPWLDPAIASHVGLLIRDFRPGGFYAAVVEHQASTFAAIGSIAEPGVTIGSIADPGPARIGKLLYNGRSRG